MIRKRIDYQALLLRDKEKKPYPWHEPDSPYRWISPEHTVAPSVTAYRIRFRLDHEAVFDVHVSADERYVLYVDGQLIGRGSEKGDLHNWYYETYQVELEAGAHTIVAQTWALGPHKGWSQISLYPGFFLAADGAYQDLVGTGSAPWECLPMGGFEMVQSAETSPFGAGHYGPGDRISIDGAQYPWGVEKGNGEGWVRARTREAAYTPDTHFIHPDARIMKPAQLPTMLEQPISGGEVRFLEAPPSLLTDVLPVLGSNQLPSEIPSWNQLLAGQASLVIPPYTRRRMLYDLGNYYCWYPYLQVSCGKGSVIRVRSAESLWTNQEEDTKGNRDIIEGKFFKGEGDTYKTDGGHHREYRPLWWLAGRYLEVAVETAEEPLIIQALELTETRYPLEMESTWESDDDRLNRMIPMLHRTLQMCSHETLMDCPYWEQLPYVGDVYPEALITYATAKDDALIRKSIELFESSRHNHTRLINCAYPENGGKTIPGFVLLWVGLVYNHMMWRGDLAFIKRMMPTAREQLDRILLNRTDDGLVRTPAGWNFVDWVSGWGFGIPPEDDGVSVIFNWMVIEALRKLEGLENYVGEPLLGERAALQARSISNRILSRYWSEDKGLIADTLDLTRFSEHTNVMAITSDTLPRETVERISHSLVTESDMERASIYLSNELFEGYRRLGRGDLLFNKLKLWFALEQQGYKTTPEFFGNTRSDCHAYGAHPLFHYFATISGIRPDAPGFEQVRIEPLLGPLTRIQARMVHPKGMIYVSYAVIEDVLHASIELPDGLSGVFKHMGRDYSLSSGKQELILS